MKISQFGLNQKIVILASSKKESATDLWQVLDNAVEQLIREIAKDEAVSAILLTESKKSVNGTFTWTEYHSSINSLVFEIDDNLFRFPKYRNMLMSIIKSSCE